MPATGVTLTFYAPTRDRDSRDPDRSAEAVLTVRCWLKRQSGQWAQTVLGVLTDKLYSCRFTLPRGVDVEIGSGWYATDVDGAEYTVKTVQRTGRMYTLIVERA